MKVKSLGILGLGSRSTIFYIKELNRLYHKKKAGYSTCPFKLWNADFDRVNNLLPETSEKLECLIEEYLTELQKLKVDAILIPNITLHQTVDKLSVLSIIIHPVHLTIARLKEHGISEIVLFGSIYMMESGYLKAAFSESLITIVLPSQTDKNIIEAVRKHTYWETETEELLREYAAIIEKYTANYAVVLACTELSVAWNSSNSRVFDMSRIQLESAVKNIE